MEIQNDGESEQTDRLLNVNGNGESLIEMKRNGGRKRSNMKVALIWTNLSFTIAKKNFFADLAKLRFRDAFKGNEKTILHPQSGVIQNGCLMAVMGKSGSGKSTLIESLTGRRGKGLKGDIRVKVGSECGCEIDMNRVKIAFIPQNDSLLETLTVQESIFYAAKLKNYNFDNKRNKAICCELVVELNLERCKNVRVSNCSGGQKKRLSVAMELVSKPTIVIMDEPTSGLDSSSALKCVQLLKKLTESTRNPLAIVVTIHQPSAKILSEFHKLYLMSSNGKCLYNGPVDELLLFFSQFNLNCPQFHNPADFAIEVASGDYGEEVLKQMETQQAKMSADEIDMVDDDCPTFEVSSIIDSMVKHSFLQFWIHTSLLMKRSAITTLRDPFLNFIRFAMHVFVALILVLLYSNNIGDESGCIFGERETNLGIYFSIDRIREMQLLLSQNLGFLFFSLMFLILASMMPTVMIFPSEMSVFLRERTNGWYSCLSFYLAKTFADFPFQITYSIIYILVTYFLTGQVNSNWRFSIFLLVLLLVSFIGQSIGLVVGAVWVSNVNTAIFIAPLSVLPFTLLSGFFVKMSMIPKYLQPVTYLSFVRFAFESLLLSIYGFNRCSDSFTDSPIGNATEQESESIHSVMFRFVNYVNQLDLTYAKARPILQALAIDRNASLDVLQSFDIHFKDFNASSLRNWTLNENESTIIQEFNVKDDDLWYNIWALVVTLILIRLFTYFVFIYKAKYRR